MATQATTVPKVKAALLALMDTALPDIPHGWGPPPPDQLRHEHIWFGDITGDGDIGALGNRSREESYSLEVFIVVQRGGYDEQTVETRAWEIAAALDAAIMDNPRLEGLGQDPIATPFQATVGGFRQRGFPIQEGASWMTEIVREIDCDATLRRT